MPITQLKYAFWGLLWGLLIILTITYEYLFIFTKDLKYFTLNVN